jgi:hypothetical protein
MRFDKDKLNKKTNMSNKEKKYNQYLQGNENDAFNLKISNFMQYLDEIGLITNKRDSFVIKRRFKMLAKDITGRFT